MALGGTPVQRSRIFISYRRADAETAAGRLAADLRNHFEQDQIFEDIASIEPGVDFEEALREGLASCAAVIVVIGPTWSTITDRQGRRRIELADDWVQQEVAHCLQSPGVRVFPVLVGDAHMPSADELPEALRPLTRRQAHLLTTRHWAKDVAQLVGHLKRIRGLAQAPAAPLSQVPAEPSPQMPPEPIPQAPTPAEKEEIRSPINSPPPDRSTSLPKQSGSPDFDQRLMDYLCDEFKKESGVDLRKDMLALQRLKDAAEKAKIELRNLQQTEVNLPFITADQSGPKHLAIKITRAKFEWLVEVPILVAPKDQQALAPGTVFRDSDFGPEMVVIPAGSFMMGSVSNEQGREDNEGPQHAVNIPRHFAVGKHQVTFDEWDACVRGGGCAHNPNDQGWGRGRRPVINVSWNDAKQYTLWLSTKTGKTYRLLSEAEWEYVARAGTTTPFNTGEHINPNQANYSKSYWEALTGGKQTVVVGSYQPNKFGLFDVHGNVWEWTEDCWNANHKGAPDDGSARTSGDCGRRVLRGGSWGNWGNSPQKLRSAFRSWLPFTFRGEGYGFRVARTL